MGCFDKFKGSDLHEFLKKKTQFDDPSTPEAKKAYIEAAKELQQKSISTTHDIYSQIGLKGYEKTEPKEVVPPPKPPEAEAVKEGGEGKTVGVSHASLTDLSERLKLDKPERGEYLPPEWYAERGRKMLAEGANPDEVNNPNNELHDRISIARAQLEKLVKNADDVAKSNPEGTNSKEYKEAHQAANDYANNVVKKLGTAAHMAMTSLQGERDIDTDSFTTVKRKLEDDLGKIASKEQETKIKNLTDKNQELKKRAEDAEAKLIEQTDKTLSETEEATPKKGVKQSSKEIANTIRKAKIHRPDSFSAATPASLVWDSAVEVVAKAIEAGGEIAEAIQKGVKYVKDSDWYKSLSDDKKKQAEEDFVKWHDNKTKPIDSSIESLWGRFADKSDNDFTKKESKAVWDYAKKNYLDKRVPYRNMIQNVANDTGLSWRQVQAAITPKYDKYLKSTSDAMWKKQSDYRRNQSATQAWIDSQSKNKALKVLTDVSGAVRGEAVFGHGGIFVGTHAGPTLFHPPTWQHTIPAFFRGWKFAYGNKAVYERQLEVLKNRPNYVLAQRAGLQNNPERINTEEYQKSQKFLGKLGLAGERGFNAIKVLRQDLFDYHYNKLSDITKADPQTAISVARLVNNATGATNIKLPKWVNEVTFAGGMEAARWEKLTRNPIEATADAMKALFSSKAKPSEKVFAKVWSSRVGLELGTFAGVLAANAAIQNALNPNNPVNRTDPTKPDFMKFKFGDITIDPTSGMRGAMLFAYGIGKIPFENQKQLKGDTRMQALGKSSSTYARGKLAPLYSTMADFFTQQDFDKNPLPFSSDKPISGKHKLTWGEYAWEKAPLPIAEAAKVTYQSAVDNGATKVQMNDLLNGIMSGAISGSSGFRVGEYNAEEANRRRSSYTEEDKSRPSFKFFLDKGMDLPNTSKTSEKINDKSTHTIKSLSDYPKETQSQYDELHKDNLEKELKTVINKGYVHVDSYGKVSESGKRTKLDDLNKDQLAEILHEAQSQANKKTKEKMFPK